MRRKWEEVGTYVCYVEDSGDLDEDGRSGEPGRGVGELAAALELDVGLLPAEGVRTVNEKARGEANRSCLAWRASTMRLSEMRH